MSQVIFGFFCSFIGVIYLMIGVTLSDGAKLDRALKTLMSFILIFSGGFFMLAEKSFKFYEVAPLFITFMLVFAINVTNSYLKKYRAKRN